MYQKQFETNEDLKREGERDEAKTKKNKTMLFRLVAKRKN